MADIKFAEGIRFFKPHSNAPDFVKGAISIDRDEFIRWASDQKVDENGRIKLDLKKSKEGNLYLSVNEYGLKPDLSNDQELKQVKKQAMDQQMNDLTSDDVGVIDESNIASEDMNPDIDM